MKLQPIGIWTNYLSRAPAPEAREAVAELDELGYGSLWFGESASSREAIANSAILLAASTRMVIATGIASIFARDATAMVSAQRTLAEAFPDRFILGIGVSHESIVTARGHVYRRPVETMRSYLDRMDAVLAGDVPAPTSPPPRLLAALGPRMLGLSRDRAQGAHPFFVPPEHTERARGILGPGRLLCPEQTVILGPCTDEAMAFARTQLAYRLSLPNYRSNLERLGFDEDDLRDGGSESLIERLIVVGDVAAVGKRVREHLDAGADAVGLHVIDPEGRLPRWQWRELAGLIDG